MCVVCVLCEDVYCVYVCSVKVCIVFVCFGFVKVCIVHDLCIVCMYMYCTHSNSLPINTQPYCTHTHTLIYTHMHTHTHTLTHTHTSGPTIGIKYSKDDVNYRGIKGFPRTHLGCPSELVLCDGLACHSKNRHRDGKIIECIQKPTEVFKLLEID